jgi:hypothetical protein
MTRRLLFCTLGVLLGLAAAWQDVAAPFGDDTAQATLLLWLASGGLLGLLQPRRPWRWAVLVAPWVPLAHLALHALGRPDPINPNTYATILLLLPVSLVACSLGAYGGSLARRLTLQP